MSSCYVLLHDDHNVSFAYDSRFADTFLCVHSEVWFSKNLLNFNNRDPARLHLLPRMISIMVARVHTSLSNGTDTKLPPFLFYSIKKRYSDERPRLLHTEVQLWDRERNKLYVAGSEVWGPSYSQGQPNTP